MEKLIAQIFSANDTNSPIVRFRYWQVLLCMEIKNTYQFLYLLACLCQLLLFQGIGILLCTGWILKKRKQFQPKWILATTQLPAQNAHRMRNTNCIICLYLFAVHQNSYQLVWFTGYSIHSSIHSKSINLR